jgi:hypothetical protein
MRRTQSILALALTLASPTAATAASDPGPSPRRVSNPSAKAASGPVVIDVAAGTVDGRVRPLVERESAGLVRFSELDAHRRELPPAPTEGHEIIRRDDGLAQIGDMIVPAEVLEGATMVRDASVVARPHAQAIPADACEFPDEVPPGIYEGDSRKGGEYPRRGTIFLNFVGGVLVNDGENSAENKSGIARSGHEYPVFGGGEVKAVAVAQAVATDFAPWAIRVVYDPRPRKLLPYTMAMVGGSYDDTTAGPSSGVAPIDCEDFGLRNVCYSFTNGEPATSQANVISQEVAHTYGLEHTYGADRIMSYEGSGDKMFGDNCQQTFALQGQGNGCQGVNKCHCGIGDLQDDQATIGIIYAPAGPDEVDPEITLTAPPDGSVYQVDEPILVDFDVWDDYGGYGWKLVVTDQATEEILVDQADYDRALEFKIAGLPPGTYTFTGEIEDQADHVATHSITIVIEGDPDAATSSEGEGSGDDHGSGDAGSSDEGSGTIASGESGDSEGQLDDDNAGCSCAAMPTPRGAALWMLAALAVRRRRGSSAR